MNENLVLNIWTYITGFASIVSTALAIYFNYREKKTQKVVKGFYNVISNQSGSILKELDNANQIQNSDYFPVLKSKVESCKYNMKNLNENIDIFRETLWQK